MQTVTAAHDVLAEATSDVDARDLWTIPDFCRRYSVSRSTAYELLGDQSLTGLKIGRATRITDESVRRWLATLPRAQVGAAA